MRFHHLSSFLIAAELLVLGNAFLYSLFPIRRRAYLHRAINILERRNPLLSTPKLCRHQPNYGVCFRDTIRDGRGYHACARTCISGLNKDTLEKTPDDAPTIDNTQKINEENTREFRRERLHYHLDELGVDADILEEAAFRSVTTTGKIVDALCSLLCNNV